jgi:hypothetical protein
MWHAYTIEYYSAVTNKHNRIIKFDINGWSKKNKCPE